MGKAETEAFGDAALQKPSRACPWIRCAPYSLPCPIFPEAHRPAQVIVVSGFNIRQPMTRKAKICQSIIIAVCLCSIAFAVYGYAVASFAHNSRISARFLLSLAVNLVFVWKIVTSPKSWSLGLGFFFALGAVALPIIFCLPGHLLHGINFNDPTIVIRHFVLPECETVISAICCFILRRELTKEVPSQLSP